MEGVLHRKQQGQDLVFSLAQKKEWLPTPNMFPAYLRLDNDPEASELEDKDAGKTLRQLQTQYQEKRQLLEATDRPVQDAFDVIDSNNSVDWQKLERLTGDVGRKEASDAESRNLKSIAASLLGISRLLGNKQHRVASITELDRDRTIEVSETSVAQLKEALVDSAAVQDQRYDVLGKCSIMLGVQQEVKQQIDRLAFNFDS